MILKNWKSKMKKREQLFSGSKLVESSFDEPLIGKDIFIAPAVAFKKDSKEFNEFVANGVCYGSEYSEFCDKCGLERYKVTHSRGKLVTNSYILQDKAGNCCVVGDNREIGIVDMFTPRGDKIAYNGLVFSRANENDYQALQSYLIGKTNLGDLPLKFFTDEYEEVRDAIVNQEKMELLYSSGNLQKEELAERAEYLESLLDEIISEAKEMEESINASNQRGA